MKINQMLIEKNKNIAALSIGFLLIALIAGITLFRQRSAPAPVTGDPDQPTAADAQPKKSYELSSEDLEKKITAGQPPLIIDTRDAGAFQQEHILDAKNIPRDSVTAALPALDKSKSYVIVDDGTGNGLTLVTDTFPQAGIKAVYHLDGGFPDWKSRNEPTISAGNPESFSDQAKVKYIKSDELNSRIAAGDSLFIIDLRSGSNFQAGHIPGATNIYIGDLEGRRGVIPFGKKVVLYDKDGLWAFQGAVKMFDMGFFNTYCLADGFDSWQQKKFPVTK
jgi:rhodanese-related sulfurtransferase